MPPPRRRVRGRRAAARGGPAGSTPRARARRRRSPRTRRALSRHDGHGRADHQPDGLRDAEPGADHAALLLGHAVGHHGRERGHRTVEADLHGGPPDGHRRGRVRGGEQQQADDADDRARDRHRSAPRPQRVRSRSDSAPHSGLATIEATAPEAVTSARSCSLPSSPAIRAAWAGSRIWIGPNQPAAMPTMASTYATTQRRLTRGWAGRVPARSVSGGDPPATTARSRPSRVMPLRPIARDVSDDLPPNGTRRARRGPGAGTDRTAWWFT